MQLCFDSFNQATDPRCTPILGPSGCGKSTMIADFVQSQCFGESSKEKPIIVIETPSNPTVKTLASEILKTIGDPLYFKGTEVQMTDRIIKYLINLKTRLIVFDELQNLIDRESDKLCFKAADWLKRLINMAKIPTAIVGLERTEELFLVNEQLRRRFTESFIFSPFDWNDEDSRRLLKGFLKAVQTKYKFDNGFAIFSNEMAYRFYCASGGLVGYMMAIVREADRLVVEKEQSVIYMEHLAKAYNNSVCGNRLAGVNPFADGLDKIAAALNVVENTKKIKRKDKEKK